MLRHHCSLFPERKKEKVKERKKKENIVKIKKWKVIK